LNRWSPAAIPAWFPKAIRSSTPPRMSRRLNPCSPPQS